jgi:hypothetical protein
MLQKLEVADPPSAPFKEVWKGEFPIRWSHDQQREPKQRVGPDQEADLFSITKHPPPGGLPQLDVHPRYRCYSPLRHSRER